MVFIPSPAAALHLPSAWHHISLQSCILSSPLWIWAEGMLLRRFAQLVLLCRSSYGSCYSRIFAMLTVPLLSAAAPCPDILLISLAIWDVCGAASSWLSLVGFRPGSEAPCVGTAPGWGSSLSAGAARPLSAHLSLFGDSSRKHLFSRCSGFLSPAFQPWYHIIYGKFSFFCCFLSVC